MGNKREQRRSIERFRRVLASRKAQRSPVAQADGVKETAEDRAAEIAEHIGVCAREMKVKPCDLTWWDFRAYAHIVYGENRLGIVRRDITRLGGYNAIRDAYFPPDSTDHSGTRLQLRQHAALNRKVGRDATQMTLVMAEVERLSSRVFKGRITPVPVRYPGILKTRPKVERVVTLMLSDLHFGSDLRADETGFLSYGRTEEARRLAFVIRQACEYKAEYRAETRLRLALGGDLIHGKLHDQVDGAILAEQMSRGIHLLSQGVAQLAAHFPEVSIHCVTGNHGRNLTRHFGRATVGKYDSNETVIYSAIKTAAARLPNVKFSIPLRPFDVYSDFGKKTFLTHGDTVIRPGNPGKSIDTTEIESQVNRWNASLKDTDEYSVFLMGHVHTPMATRLANGAHVVTNGCLIPVDNFCVSIGLPETVCSQVMFEAVEGYPVGDLRMISLDPAVDKAKDLDKIISPWSEF